MGICESSILERLNITITDMTLGFEDFKSKIDQRSMFGVICLSFAKFYYFITG
jgi:hypothetical protein